MTEEQQKEQFSIAYVRAVAAAAGVNVSKPELDEDSVDIRFSVLSVEDSLVPPVIEAQLKCTAKHKPKKGTLSFPLNIKNYRELRGNRLTPRYLIVLVVPNNLSDWLKQSEKQLLLRKCAYWASLREEPESSNTDKVTVHLETVE